MFLGEPDLPSGGPQQIIKCENDCRREGLGLDGLQWEVGVGGQGTWVGGISVPCCFDDDLATEMDIESGTGSPHIYTGPSQLGTLTTVL